MSGKLQKGGTAPRQSSAEHAASSAVRKPLPNNAVYPRTVPLPGPDYGIYLPAPGQSGVDKRHSSYDYSRSPSGAVPAASSSHAGNGLQRPFAPDGTLQVHRLRPSASASNLPRQQHAPTTATSTLQKEHKDDKSKKSGWFGSSKDKKDDFKLPAAWVIAPGKAQRIAFDVDSLLAGAPAGDFWDAQGNCFIHLFPASSGKGPSFRVDSSIFAASAQLTKQTFGRLYTEVGRTIAKPNLQAQLPDLPPHQIRHSDGVPSTRTSLDAQADDVHLYLDLAFNGKPPPHTPKKSAQTFLSEDAESMVAARNLFAFLCGQALVATERRFTMYSIFMRIADQLQHYGFTNMDGSSFGEIAITSFDSYVAELGMADVRKSVQKNIEMIVLGERMRSVSLYNEAFTHAVGRYEEIRASSAGAFKNVSQVTQTRLSRAAMDLEKKKQHIDLQLVSFEFPSIFAGIMSSKTSDERRSVNFDAWRAAFLKMRSFLAAYYKDFFGSWPPKPHPKKNSLQTGGLNRIVLLTLYNDLAALYDLLADRKALTNRTSGGILDTDHIKDSPRMRALRHILSEYDRSSPPVKPPVPFDLPRTPDLHALRPEYGKDKRADAKFGHKSLKTEEAVTVLKASHNHDVPQLPFIRAFCDFEQSQAKGDTLQEISDLRDGQWICLYAVLQLLPLLVVDAPGLAHTDDVEYFLCQASRGGVPWARAGGDRAASQTWFGVAGGASVVSLPSDVIEHSIDGVYRRSHCWQMAERWSRDNPLLNAAMHEQQAASTMSDVPQQFPPRLSADLPPLPGSGFQQGTSVYGGSASSRATGQAEMLMPPTIPAARGEIRNGSRNSSPARSARNSVIDLGLEALPMPSGLHPEPRRPSAAGSFGGASTPNGGGSVAADSPRVRPVSTHVNDPATTFDAILASASPAKGKKDRKKK